MHIVIFPDTKFSVSLDNLTKKVLDFLSLRLVFLLTLKIFYNCDHLASTCLALFTVLKGEQKVLLVL